MTTWDEWFTYLGSRLDGRVGGRLPSEPCAGLIDDLRSTARLLGDLAENIAASHYRAASMLYAQGRETAWLPAALPNSEESRLVKRVIVRRRRR
jgi:hypothetical protein